MINKTELRVGNYLKALTCNKEPSFITGVTAGGVHFPAGILVAFESLIPVIITEEILTQAGFIYGRKYCQSNYYDVIAVWIDNDEKVWAFKRNKEILKYIKYLHEAQNLFFDLESKELISII